MNDILELIELNEELEEKDKEIERLNNIIKELQEDIDILTSDDDNDSVWLEKNNM